MIWPDWNKLFAEWNCLYYGVPFSDAQRDALNNAKTEVEREQLVNWFRKEYLAAQENKEAPKAEEVKEEKPVEEDKTTKSKKGK